MADANVRPVIWFIDEKEDEQRVWGNALRSALLGAVEIRSQVPFKTLEEYLPLLSDLQTVAIITDQRLKNSGVAPYTGIELAEYIRTINTKLPVYILTNFPDDEDAFEGLTWSVEDIIGKKELNDPEARKVIAARILRRVNTFRDILGERSERIRELLLKSSQNTLSASELDELERLGFEKSSSMLAEQLTQARQLDQLIQVQESLMRRYREFIAESDSKEV